MHRLLFFASLLLLAFCAGYVLGSLTTLLWIGIAIAAGFTFQASRERPSFQRTLRLAFGPLTIVTLLLIDNGSLFDHAGPWLLAGALAILFLLPPPSFPLLPATVFATALTLLFLSYAFHPQWPHLLSPWTSPVWCAIALFPLLRFQASRVLHAMTFLLLTATVILSISSLPQFTAIAHDQSRAALQLHRTLNASAAAQASIPAGAPVLVCVAYPMAFDFKRNPIIVSDWPVEFLGRNPPIPLAGPTLPVLDYLRRRGYRHAIITPPDAPDLPPESIALRDALVRAIPPARWRYHSGDLAVLDLSDEMSDSPTSQPAK